MEDDWGISDGEVLEDWPPGVPLHGSLPHALSFTLNEQESPTDVCSAPEKATDLCCGHLSTCNAHWHCTGMQKQLSHIGCKLHKLQC